MAANEGHFEEAERFFQIVLNDDKESASAWSNLGNVHLSLGRPQEADNDFTTAIGLAPEVHSDSLQGPWLSWRPHTELLKTNKTIRLELER